MTPAKQRAREFIPAAKAVMVALRDAGATLDQIASEFETTALIVAHVIRQERIEPDIPPRRTGRPPGKKNRASKKRENDVRELTLQGHTARQIAYATKLSKRTVERYRTMLIRRGELSR